MAATSPPVNDRLVELLAMVDACRRANAARIVAIMPYFGYARSDRRDGRRTPIMARLGASYTMAQERVVHQSVLAELGLNDLEIARPEALPSSASNFDDGLF